MLRVPRPSGSLTHPYEIVVFIETDVFAEVDFEAYSTQPEYIGTE